MCLVALHQGNRNNLKTSDEGSQRYTTCSSPGVILDLMRNGYVNLNKTNKCHVVQMTSVVIYFKKVVLTVCTS